MSDILTHAIAALSEKLGDGFDGSAKFEITGEGSIVVDADGVRAGDDETDVTMIASAETFRGILSGDVNPTMAFMTGKLKVEGSMGMAMKLGAARSCWTAPYVTPTLRKPPRLRGSHGCARQMGCVCGLVCGGRGRAVWSRCSRAGPRFWKNTAAPSQTCALRAMAWRRWIGAGRVCRIG